MALEVVGRGQKITVHRDPLWAPGHKRAIITLHDQHFDAGDGVYDKPVVEAYGALTADAGGYTSGANQMRHALKVDDTGNRLWLPRRNVDSQSMRFGRPRYSLDPLGPTPNWTNLPLGAPSRQGGLVKWTRPLYEIGAWVTWRKIGLGWRILSNLGSDIVGLQIPVTLTGLQFDADTFQLKSAGLVLATVNVSDAVDATGKAFPVTRRINGGAIEYTMDLTGAVYPVTVTPLNDTLVLGDAAGELDIDTYLREEFPNNNYATMAMLTVGTLTGERHIALLKPDLSSLSGATITSATLSLYNWTTSGLSYNFAVARLLAANDGWTEAGARWLDKDGTNKWAGDSGADGGTDAGASVSGTDYSATNMGTGSYTANDPAGTEVPFTLDTTEFTTLVANNYGIHLRLTTASRTVTILASSDNTTSAYRPTLTVGYTTGGGAALKQSVSDVLQVTESAARALALRRFSASSLQVSESIKQALALRRGTADTVNVAEAAGKAAALRRLVAETVNVIEASRAARGLRRLVAETVTVDITDLITDGGFETAGAGGADVWANWTEAAADGAIADETVITHGGGHAAKLTKGPTGDTFIYTIAFGTVPGIAYSLQFWTRGDGTNAGRYTIGDNTHGVVIGVDGATTGISGTTYEMVSTTFVAPAGCLSVIFYFKPGVTNGAVAYFDDVSCINHAASWAALGLRRSVADIIGLAETTSSGIATSIVKAINEALQLAETSLRTLALSRPVAETVQILESVIRPARWLRLVAETVTIAEATKAARALRRFASDVVQIVEATGRTLTQPGVVTAIVKNIAETLQLIEARSIAKWPTGRLGIDIRRGYAIIRAAGRLYAAVVQGRQYRARHEK